MAAAAAATAACLDHRGRLGPRTFPALGPALALGPVLALRREAMEFSQAAATRRRLRDVAAEAKPNKTRKIERAAK